jgi:carbonic anhydrase
MKLFKQTSYMAALLLGFLLTFTSCKQNSNAAADAQTSADSTAQAASARPAHWSYSEEGGATNWGNLSPAYALCKEGKHQSPVDIVETQVKGAGTWQLNYKSTSLNIAHTEHMDDIVDNGHTIQVSVDEGSTLTYAGKTYHLKQFHFHTPSEHTINGQHMPMEMHMVHQSDDGALAVVGVLIKEGKEANPNFATIISNFPAAKGESKHITDQHLELDLQMPKDNAAYHYIGSLTTPPCSENVQWLVLHDMLSLSKDQIDAFASRIGPNNRPTQPLNDRFVNADDLTGKVTQ